jgi:hypothetical protein
MNFFLELIPDFIGDTFGDRFACRSFTDLRDLGTSKIF